MEEKHFDKRFTEETRGHWFTNTKLAFITPTEEDRHELYIVDEEKQTIVTIDGKDYDDIKKILKYIDTIKVDKKDLDWLTDKRVSGLEHHWMMFDKDETEE